MKWGGFAGDGYGEGMKHDARMAIGAGPIQILMPGQEQSNKRLWGL